MAVHRNGTEQWDLVDRFRNPVFAVQTRLETVRLCTNLF
jgi:hypothetical protein